MGKINRQLGRGLNSIPLRFCLMSFALSGVCTLGLFYFTVQVAESETSWQVFATVILLAAATPALVTYVAARSLSREIMSLQLSTEAIAAGDMNRVVNFDCACEVGVLAESFRKMVRRLNANILRMNSLAHIDGITGLPNRVVIDHVLSLAAREPGGCCGSLFFIDIDDFKAINDSLGHHVGDQILKAVAQRIATEGFDVQPEEIDNCTTSFGELRDSCPTTFFFGRFAGDEFVAILPETTDSSEIERRASAILASLRAPFEVQGNVVRVGVSIGIARAPQDAVDPSELLAAADIAMFEAKKKGKNAFVFCDQKLQDRTREKNAIEAELRRAVDAGAIQLHFQPKLDAKSLALAGVEALARWTHPVRGVIPPGTFIPVAEQAGLMPALGRAVALAAIKQMKVWKDRGLRIPVAINVSAAQLDDPLFVPELLAMLQYHKIDPALIEVEITETMVMTDFCLGAERIGALRDSGIAIAIDDFGVGFSNFSQLAKLPVSSLKIDRSLVNEIGVDRKADEIVKATVEMAHALGHTTVAEGVETQQQATFLRMAKCDKLQGFLFARPMPPEELERWIDERSANALEALQPDLVAGA